jgi:hypothetical protein
MSDLEATIHREYTTPRLCGALHLVGSLLGLKGLPFSKWSRVHSSH